jgi:hypothetical protein
LRTWDVSSFLARPRLEPMIEQVSKAELRNNELDSATKVIMYWVLGNKRQHFEN